MNVRIISLAIGVVIISISLSLWLLMVARKTSAIPPSAPPLRVGVVTLKSEPITLTSELPGRAAAWRNAEVRPQVAGIIQKRLFTEGDEVKAQQPLYQIDPALYQAELKRASAALARARAQLSSAALLVQRYRPLADSRAISRQAYDDALVAHQQAQADVQAAEAARETARINLEYTQVLSPIDGVIGRSAVTEGALVTSQQSAAVATIQQIDPIYIDVTQSSAQLLRLKSALASGALTAGDDRLLASVTLTLEDGSRYAHQGQLQFSEISVDRSTGSVVLRAMFPNPQRQLLPGMFVRARIVDGVAPSGGLLVPQRGVTHNPQGDATALVVDESGKVALRAIKTERAIGNQWLVSTGLSAGDKVIVEGIQQARPGAQAIAEEWQPPAVTAQRTAQRKEPDHG
ncbi:efflux RND transporter periplasmic adaptor subunit [Klebsiella pneumoniae]|uniref:efflux RND transporter periplasmic adaptor subunit n=1 Tax=Enterobacteriaceae TaxID=543 RepID=UPI001156CC18|nr:efflux RND transporter periplasmic adaptor subunit [Klebsiella pneumoniae]ELY2785153.1 efflux RND transporter periplasmic adaptor subunit [Cronobacter turicensis]ELA0994045.1 efflux RND transporter periplasmic adaptor subunit [Klebsiella pneumoniae]MCU8675167.1 efflux RND transporter periplasmic adaptor subunit [Klebsiella pneumoniae]MCU8688526.1 efflux RND transporter periplasmic adaptor subunit [Klebsiella pneumoniae]HBR3463626.1 efflux RND transporter periplasmic adaptor subunit [Klebsie